MSTYDDDDDGLPDAAFTEDELAAGVQHLARGHDRGYLAEYLAEEDEINESGADVSNIKSSSEFFDRIQYRKVGHLNIERMKSILRQIRSSNLKSLQLSLNEELESCYAQMRRFEDHNLYDHNARLQAGDVDVMIKELNFLID